MVDGSVFWLRRLARKIVVRIISPHLHGGEEGVEEPKWYIDLKELCKYIVFYI